MELSGTLYLEACRYCIVMSSEEKSIKVSIFISFLPPGLELCGHKRF